MTKVTVKTGVELEMHLVLNETEARALDALVGYGVDPFRTDKGLAYMAVGAGATIKQRAFAVAQDMIVNAANN